MAIGMNVGLENTVRAPKNLPHKAEGSSTRQDIVDTMTLNPTIFVARTVGKMLKGEGPCEAVDHTFKQVTHGIGSLLSKVVNVVGQ